MSQKLFLICHGAEVPTNHFVRWQCRLAAGLQADQHARDNRPVDLDFNALL